MCEESMFDESLRKIIAMLETHSSTLQSEKSLLEEHQKDDKLLCEDIRKEIELQGHDESLSNLEKLQRLEHHLDLLKRTKKTVERAIDEVRRIRKEMQLLQYNRELSSTEAEVKNLRTRREKLNDELIPKAEIKRDRYLDESKQIDSRLQSLSEELSLLRRRNENGLEEDR